MPTLTFDPSEEGPTTEQAEAEAQSLAQGEKLEQANLEDRARRLSQADAGEEDISLIGGKFKSQDDLLAAYRQLEQKLGSSKEEVTDEEVADEAPVAEEEQVSDEPSETVKYMEQLGKVYDEQGSIPDEAVEALSQMDAKELVSSYLKYYSNSEKSNQETQMAVEAITDIKNSVGGENAYSEMITWAAGNLPANEIDDFNAVANSGSPVAIKFAVEALSNRYRNTEGYEAPLVTGRKAKTGTKGYRSQAELARDISNPKYANDPAFRQDVEARLSISQDLL